MNTIGPVQLARCLLTELGLHTNNARKTVDRMIDVFPADQQSQVRTMLAASLRGVIAQLLMKKADGSGRVAVNEILVVNSAASAIVREGATQKLQDVIVGAVLIPGAVAPKLLKKSHLKMMKPGSVIVDVAIDLGGCFETSRVTKHSDPIYVQEGIIHYCVGNMPGAYARTATFGLTNATLPYGLRLANKGVEQACRESQALRMGLNMYKGVVTFKGVADAFNMEYKTPESVIG